MKRIFVCVLCACGIVVGAATEARAQTMGAFRGYLTAQAGLATGGDVADPIFTPGIAVSVQEANGWGAEIDFGHTTDLVSGRQVLDVNTYMVNGNWIQPRGRLKPFVSAGLGSMQVNGCDSPCTRPANTYDLGINAGGGVLYGINDWIGVRGDARYFRSSSDHPDLGRPSNFSFWRVSLGVTFLWAIVP
jgi:opacity protein-like surface antigen